MCTGPGFECKGCVCCAGTFGSAIAILMLKQIKRFQKTNAGWPKKWKLLSLKWDTCSFGPQPFEKHPLWLLLTAVACKIWNHVYQYYSILWWKCTSTCSECAFIWTSIYGPVFIVIVIINIMIIMMILNDYDYFFSTTITSITII